MSGQLLSAISFVLAGIAGAVVVYILVEKYRLQRGRHLDLLFPQLTALVAIVLAPVIRVLPWEWATSWEGPIQVVMVVPAAVIGFELFKFWIIDLQTYETMEKEGLTPSMSKIRIKVYQWTRFIGLSATLFYLVIMLILYIELLR